MCKLICKLRMYNIAFFVIVCEDLLVTAFGGSTAAPASSPVQQKGGALWQFHENTRAFPTGIY